MHLRITGDVNEASGVAEVIFEISGPTRKYFEAKEYGDGLHGIGVILMCRNPELNFHQRIRLAKKEKKLYMDIMLDLEQMKGANPAARKRMILDKLANEIPAILKNYSISNFDEQRFAEDLKSYLIM